MSIFTVFFFSNRGSATTKQFQNVVSILILPIFRFCYLLQMANQQYPIISHHYFITDLASPPVELYHSDECCLLKTAVVCLVRCVLQKLGCGIHDPGLEPLRENLNVSSCRQGFGSVYIIYGSGSGSSILRFFLDPDPDFQCYFLQYIFVVFFKTIFFVF